jgi:cell cycle checkpoint protein
VTFERSGGTQSDPAARARTGAAAATTSSTQALWAEAHAPTSIESVCVAPKKAKEILQWLEEGGDSSGLLVLGGSPGIGKSTAVRVLARTHGFALHEWSESVSSSSSAFYNPEILAQPTPLDSFEAFLQQSRVGYSSIVSSCGGRTSGDPINGTRSRAVSSSKTASNTAKKDQRSLILLEEIPNLHGAEMEDRFRRMFTTHVVESAGRATRTILVWSDVTEGRHHRDDLERLVQPHVLYDARYVHILQVHPPTRARFGKVVDSIAKLHKMRNVDVQALYDASGGDVRFAITSLQFDGGSTTSRATSAASSGQDGRKRDERLNPMHALGKLLYAKRKESGGAAPSPNLASPSEAATIASRWHDLRGPLTFDPDDVLDRCEMELPGALQFLAYHAPDFMTDVEELGDALASYSDAAWLMDAKGSRTHHASAPAAQRLVTNLAGAVAGRAVSTFNVHPAPFKFRQLSKPRSFDALRRRSENQAMLRHALSKKTAASLEGVDQYATDSLAFVRRIRPEAAPQLESFVASSTSREWRPADRLRESDESSVAAFSTLEGDDIAEYSDGEDLPERNHVEMPRLSFQLTNPVKCDATPTTVATSPASSASTP